MYIYRLTGKIILYIMRKRYMVEEENTIKTELQGSSHTCGCSHPLSYASPKTYSGPSKEQIEESLNSLFLSVLERLEREGRLEELMESLNNQ